MEIQELEKLNFVVDPFTATTDDVAHISCTAEEELIDIQNNIVAKRFYDKEGFLKFWLEKCPTLAPILTNIAISDCILPFATTYLAETAFSAVTVIKTKARNRLVIHNDLRMALTNIPPNIEELVKFSQGQGSH